MLNWERLTPHIDISSPAAEIDFSMIGALTSGNGHGEVNVVLKFSLFQDGFPNDIQIKFKRDSVLAHRYVQEPFDEITGFIGDAPKISRGLYKDATYPLLTAVKSIWLQEFAEVFHDKTFAVCKHYLFASLNDIVEILASEDPEIQILNTKTRTEN